ncbi:MAG: hypothetical protein P4L53_15150 [Candidatus Obscuribacterales bacterium]|nr:hypothetical protein [Candidatus Obscuribacterales bacterium]
MTILASREFVKEEAEVAATSASSVKPPRLGKRSVFMVSAVAFIAINFLLSFAEPFDFDPYRFLLHGWSWWTMQDLRSDKDLHNVALLGSSLMVSAVATADANYLNHPLDLTQYHKASYLDHVLSTAFGGKFDTFNLSAPGQMPSDAYLMLQAMVNTSQRPDVVIYGVAPRDFIDSTLGSPTDTESYRYLKRLVNTDEIASGLYRSPLPRFDWYLQKHLFLYGSALDLQMMISDVVQVVVDRLVPRPWSSTPFTWWDRRRILPSYLGAEIFPGSMMSVPVTRDQADRQFDDDTQNYKDRYKHPETAVFKTQFYFLRKLTAYCRREKIDLILINMPLTQINLDILKAENHANYVRELEKFAFEQGLAEINLCDLSLFNLKDFHDSVHLNAFGGTKFFDQLVTKLGKIQGTSGALKMAGLELDRRKNISASASAAGGSK